MRTPFKLNVLGATTAMVVVVNVKEDEAAARIREGLAHEAYMGIPKLVY